MAQHKALGRGLEALFSASKQSTPPAKGAGSVEITERNHDIRDIDIAKIQPNRHQPRTTFAPEALEELAESIKLHGIAQPLVVTEKPGEGQFELVMGERRLRAAKLAGLTKVPCVVKSMSHRERFELALIENIQREDLNAMEEATALDGLMKEFNLTQEQVAMALGKSRSTIANVLRFLRLHENVQAALRSGQITEGHAKCLAGISEHSEQLRLLGKIIDEGLSVRDLEALLSSKSEAKESAPKAPERVRSAEVKKYEEEFQRVLGRRVEIQTSGKKGWLRFAFYSPWDLDILCKRLNLIKGDANGDAAPPPPTENIS